MYKINDTFSFKIDKSNYVVYIFIYNTVILMLYLCFNDLLYIGNDGFFLQWTLLC